MSWIVSSIAFGEAYGNLANSLKELGDINAAVQFYLKAIKLKPRFSDAYNNLACAYMQMGKLNEAMETFQMALVLNPGLVDGHSNLGNLCKARGDFDAAKKCFLEAIRIRPDFAIAWNNLAGVFKDEGQLTTAIAYYKEALRLCPDFADAHSNLGNAFKEQNDIEDAIACYETAVKLRPDFAIAHGNLASCFYDQGNYQIAIQKFKYAIQLEPNYPDAYNNLGNAFRETGETDEAINCYRSCLRLKQDHPHAYNNLGNALKDKGYIKEAIHCYVTALRLMPHFAAAHSNIASVLKEQGKVDQALAHYSEAIEIAPDFADAHCNLGNLYKDMENFTQAIESYQIAIKITPTFAEAHANLATAYKDMGNFSAAIEAYEEALRLRPDFPLALANYVHARCAICDWRLAPHDLQDDIPTLFNKLVDQVEEDLLAGSKHLGQGQGEGQDVSQAALSVPTVQPVHSLAFPLSMRQVLDVAQSYAAKEAANVSLVETHYRYLPRSRSSKIHIGYISSDFGNHPISHLLLGALGLHNTEQFYVTCYALSASDESAQRRTIETSTDVFKDVSHLHAGDVAQLVQNDGIHILINLNGYTKGNKNGVFALHPAPLQISMLGHSGTTGAEYIDYLVADPTTVPQNLRNFYSESMIYMPHCLMVNNHKAAAKSLIKADREMTRAHYGIPQDKFVFCCFNQLFKISPDLFKAWILILKAVDNSILWLLEFPEAGKKNLLRHAFEMGVREDRFIFTPVAPRDEHIQRSALADLFLDTWSMNGASTACDVLWAGTPLVTRQGDKMAARVASSALSALGLEELVAKTDAQYIELATELALERDKLFDIRQRLARRREGSALFDTERWVRNFEKGLLEIMARHEADRDPVDVRVEDTEPIVVEKDVEIAIL
jgi:protein O-GlcNAc transferase